MIPHKELYTHNCIAFKALNFDFCRWCTQVADEMLEFWCNFVEAIASSSIKEVEDRFRPYIDRLVVCLCMLCKFDASEVSLSYRLICLII